ncbi:hypothetical protein Taro_042447 [Colocasia esculenta]|uniref:Uncharacterized protein n=1 Tax=Colocasia esculenta TaxID=4460 RepID=A0A843X2M0_COLES|nr:hypothetical protein [Colocasia esculenta]
MHGATNHHHDRPATNSCDSESLPEENRGGEPRKQGSVGITNPLPAKAAGTPTSGNKTTLQSSKAGNTYCRVLQSRENIVNTSTTTPANRRCTPSRQRSSRNTGATKRDQNLKTSTNIPDLHEVEKEQPGVTMRDTEQPCEKHHLTTGTTTSNLHKVEGPQTEPPCTLGTPRG